MSQSQDNRNKSKSAPAGTDTATDSQMPNSTASKTQAEMAQAFKDLARGEQQAAALEANLASLESKLDALLAAFEASSGTVPPEEEDKDKEIEHQGQSFQVRDGAQGEDKNGDRHSDQVKKI